MSGIPTAIPVVGSGLLDTIGEIILDAMKQHGKQMAAIDQMKKDMLVKQLKHQENRLKIEAEADRFKLLYNGYIQAGKTHEQAVNLAYDIINRVKELDQRKLALEKLELYYIYTHLLVFLMGGVGGVMFKSRL